MKLVLLLLWTAVIAGATTLPWHDYTGHTHWDSVRWIPFHEHHLVGTDILLNVLLFVPFGFLLTSVRSGAPLDKWVIFTLVIAAVLSICAEYFQVYCHNRIPSATDVCTNVVGAGLGVFLERRCKPLVREAKDRVESPSSQQP